MTKIAFQERTGLGPTFELGIESLPSVAALDTRRLQRLAGTLQQRFRPGAVAWINGDTYAGGQQQVASGNRGRRCDLGDQSIEPIMHFGLAQPEGYHAELVVAEPGDHVIVVSPCQQSRSDQSQDPVAGGNPKGLVDRLEPIEIEQDDLAAS